MSKDALDWVRPEVKALQAYHVPNANNLIKLDAMENPYSWPPELVQQWLSCMESAAVNRYPDPDASSLKKALRKAFAIPDSLDVMLGNGSDELIQLIAMALAKEGSCILSPEPGFAMYRIIATSVGMQYYGVPLNDDFTLPLQACLAAINTHRPALIFIAHPNNPTGNAFSVDDIKAIIQAAPGVVVLDEAYSAFAEHSFLNDIEHHPHVLLMRTVSKIGLAGLRLGYLVGAPALIQQINKLRLPYNINVLTQVTAEFALEHIDVLEAQVAQLKQARAELADALAQVDRLQVYPSQTNFLTFRVPGGKGSEWYEFIKAEGVLIKNLSSAGGLLKDCLRVTVGAPDENQAFLAALNKAVNC